MRILYLSFIVSVILSGTRCTTEESNASKKDSSTIGSAKENDTVGVNDENTEEADGEPEFDETELNFIVSVAEGYNYDSLKAIALRSSSLLKLKYDTLGRYYNPKKGRVVLPDNDEDEMWAGEYFLRRYGNDFVSIEMRNDYVDTTLINSSVESDKFNADTTKMFVFASMYPNKKSADSLADILKKDFPSTKIIAARIYMGCMH